MPILHIGKIILLFFAMQRLAIAHYDQHNFGITAGKGDPAGISGAKLHYRNLLFRTTNHKVKWFAEFAAAHWQTDIGERRTINMLIAAPILRIMLLENLRLAVYLDGSVGIVKKSHKKLANKTTGSSWTLQDIIGIGIVVNKKIDIRMQYLHYSNAGLFKPNPGTDFAPIFTISYNI